MLIWTAITAISTSIACIIALFLPIVLHKMEHNKKLHILVDSQLCMDVANNIEEPLLTVQISNIGNIRTNYEINMDIDYSENKNDDVILVNKTNRFDSLTDRERYFNKRKHKNIE